MVNTKAFPYLCFVRFDLVNKEFDRQFNIHFDDHIQELADRPGYIIDEKLDRVEALINWAQAQGIAKTEIDLGGSFRPSSMPATAI